MRKTMSEMQLDFCREVYEQVQEVLFLRTPFAEDREVIFQLNQRTESLGRCYLYDSWTARIEISEYALDDKLLILPNGRRQFLHLTIGSLTDQLCGRINLLPFFPHPYNGFGDFLRIRLIRILDQHSAKLLLRNRCQPLRRGDSLLRV